MPSADQPPVREQEGRPKGCPSRPASGKARGARPLGMSPSKEVDASTIDTIPPAVTPPGPGPGRWSELSGGELESLFGGGDEALGAEDPTEGVAEEPERLAGDHGIALVVRQL